jgi:selenocysteine-specific elongation factor
MLLREALRNSQGITVGEIREIWDTSRKYAVPLLEFFDRQRVTRRIGDKRILAKN